MHALSLDLTPLGKRFVVANVQGPAHAPEWATRLQELGFITGEQVTLMVRGVPGGDPLVVRVGASTFAIRRAEAACVLVEDAP